MYLQDGDVDEGKASGCDEEGAGEGRKEGRLERRKDERKTLCSLGGGEGNQIFSPLVSTIEFQDPQRLDKMDRRGRQRRRDRSVDRQ